LALLAFIKQFDFIKVAPKRLYTMTSRRSVVPNAFLGNPIGYAQLMLIDNPDLKWFELMRKFGATDKDSLFLATKYDLTYAFNSLRDYFDEPKWRLVFSDGFFQDIWNETARSKREEVNNWVETNTSKESLDDIIFVDLGWNGTIQKNLVFSLIGSQKIHGIYFGLTEDGLNSSLPHSTLNSIICHQNRDFFSHPSFLCPNLLELFLLAPHPSPKSLSEEFGIVDIEKWISEHPDDNPKLAYQANVLGMMKEFELGYLMFRPSQENIAQLVRTLQAKMILLPQLNFIQQVTKMNTSYGFGENQYRLIENSPRRLNSIRKSHWRYGASRMRLGQFMTILLVARDSLSWGTPGYRKIQTAKVQFTSTSSFDFKASKDDFNNELSSQYISLLECYKNSNLVWTDQLNRKDLINLKLIISCANLFRLIKGKTRFSNFTIPFRKIIYYRVLK
jgi:hypothetical protein